MNGLGEWDSAIKQSSQLKACMRISKRLSRGKSLLSVKGPTSGPRESAAVHHAQSSLLRFSDGTEKGDNDPAVGRTVETLSVAGSDGPARRQEKETRSAGGIPSR
ncbi:MAG: hypothetical protein P1Q69_06870 [Candidatus Thorarchaeota archaeon]|nr:hypothetical protein [Candidatus Thorarchaeota archaeon]